MNFRKTLLGGMLAASLSLGSGTALAQEGTPMASPDTSPVAEPAEGDIVMGRFPLSTPDGAIAAYVEAWEGENGVTFKIESTVDSGLEPGTHGIHIHEVGACDASGDTPYASAGGHFNPTDTSHGAPDDDDSHAGDLGNLEVNDDGTLLYVVTTDKVTLDPAADNSLAGPSGSALLIHAGEDDLETDPSGESGDRVACGIIFRSFEPAMNTTPPSVEAPSASPEATPAS